MGSWTLANKEKEEYNNEDAQYAHQSNKREKFTQGNSYDINYTVVLATACLRIQTGTFISPICRALCDTGAQASMISNACVKKLNLQTQNCYVSVSGVGGSVVFKKKVQGYITPRFDSDFRLFVQFFVGDDFGQTHPNMQIDALRPDNAFTLADDNFHIPGPIDMLLGADVWGLIIKKELYNHATGAVMHNTALGHIILGRYFEPSHQQTNCVILNATNAVSEILECEATLENMLQRFFNAEEIAEPSQILTHEEKKVEEFYVKNSYRRENGLYVTKIPLRANKTLGESRNIVRRRFYSLERKLQADPALKNEYIEFMRAFISLGHMQKAPMLNCDQMHYYIPHHAVRSSGRFRTVFDASCKTSNGESLNSIQMVGPKLQCDLHFQIMRFRRNKYAVIADIVKMYRQIGIDPSQWELQRIFWREDPTHPLIEYHITRIIYGLASSGFSAVRTMHQCAMDYAKQFPEAAKIIMKCFYMDDGLWGADTINELKMLCREVQFVLSEGKFQLSKWASNSRAVEKLMQGDEAPTVDICDANAETKVLGLRWLKDSDEFTIFVRKPKEMQSLTKRYIISEIARLYDPNGYVAPVIVTAKILMQNIWQLPKQDWDAAVPAEFQRRWIEFVEGLPELGKFRIPRWLSITKGIQMQIHGFCDASNKAYGAVLYLRVIDEQNQVKCTLLTSKSKVVPLKQITIPRLELLAALLCSKLTHQVVNACEFYVKQYLWSDSMIALHWIKRPPSELKVYVANRVQEIRNNARHATWSHIATKENPADLISRGVQAADFIKSNLWKHGPEWLLKPQNVWPKSKLIVTPELQAKINEEVKTQCNVNLTLLTLTYKQTVFHEGKTQEKLSELYMRSNNLAKILRITAYVLRFIEYLRLRRRDLRIRGEYPLPFEMHNAAMIWVKHAQLLAYKKDIEAIKSNNALLKSKIASLQPKLDSQGILRVGGRIDKALIPYTQKHPIIVPPRSRLAYLLLCHAHEETKHGGVQAMTAYLRNEYWMPQMRQQARSIVSRCTRCVRYAQKTTSQIMAELPAIRLRPAKPFDATGIDLAGPIMIKLSDKLNLSTRSKANLPEVKGWIAVFVCLVTRAVHLEPIMDLSADAFLQAYIRFVSRRGNPQINYSDHGTNFKASDRLLREATQVWADAKIQHYASCNYTQWKFITPGAPHEGGIWEAAVKSMKHHLRRILGPQKYSYEGIATLLASIEACLNSRPLCAMSDDPSDMETLTPAHFLIGGPLKLPLPEKSEEPPKTAKRLYATLQSQTQSFWKHWSQDYLHTLMHRPKWKETQENVKVDQLALIKDENLPPTYWAIGRIIKTHKGTDGNVRSVTLKTQNTTLSRSIRKICILPTDHELDYFAENENHSQPGECTK